MAAVEADLTWAADLDALPPAVWAAQSSSRHLPVVLDSHELHCDLEYLPVAFRDAWKVLGDRFIPYADLVVVVSPEFSEVLEREHGAKRTVVILNLAMAGPEPEKTVRDVLQLGPKVPLIVHIGAVYEDRHPGYAINLLVDRPDAHFAFVGQVLGKGLQEKLCAQADELGVGARLHFVDQVPMKHLTGFLRSADLSILIVDPAISRNFEKTIPNKLFDSLAAGVPVVATSGTAPGRLVASERLGGTFPFGDLKEFSRVVSELLVDEDLRRDIESRADEFLFTRVEEKLDELLRDLINPAPRASVPR